MFINRQCNNLYVYTNIVHCKFLYVFNKMTLNIENLNFVNILEILLMNLSEFVKLELTNISSAIYATNFLNIIVLHNNLNVDYINFYITNYYTFIIEQNLSFLYYKSLKSSNMQF